MSDVENRRQDDEAIKQAFPWLWGNNGEGVDKFLANVRAKGGSYSSGDITFPDSSKAVGGQFSVEYNTPVDSVGGFGARKVGERLYSIQVGSFNLRAGSEIQVMGRNDEQRMFSGTSLNVVRNDGSQVQLYTLAEMCASEDEMVEVITNLRNKLITLDQADSTTVARELEAYAKEQRQEHEAKIRQIREAMQAKRQSN